MCAHTYTTMNTHIKELTSILNLNIPPTFIISHPFLGFFRSCVSATQWPLLSFWIASSSYPTSHATATGTPTSPRQSFHHPLPIPAPFPSHFFSNPSLSFPMLPLFKNRKPTSTSLFVPLFYQRCTHCRVLHISI